MTDKRVYAMSSGSYSDYSVNCLLRADDGADFQALFDEFVDYYYSITPPFAEEEPTVGWNNVTVDHHEAWRDRLYKYDQSVRKDWNARGYEGYDKQDMFVSWLIKDKGFELIEYIEYNTDSLHEKTWYPAE